MDTRQAEIGDKIHFAVMAIEAEDVVEALRNWEAAASGGAKGGEL